MPTPVRFKSLKGVELFTPGKWNGTVYTKKDIDGIMTAYDHFKDLIGIPLKFGHNEDQPMTDGQPALGWLENVRMADDGETILGDFEDMPDIVYKAVESKMYNSLSIELDVGVVHDGKKFPYVLSGVALIGADLPAVNVLSDLEKYIGSSNKTLRRLNSVTKIRFSTNKGGNTMTLEEMEAELKATNAKLTAITASNAKLASENAELSSQVAVFTAEKTKNDAAKAKAAFSTAKQKLVDTMETLVKAGSITPHQRDAFSKQIVEDDMASVENLSSTIDVLASGVDTKKFSKGADVDKSKSKSDNSGDEPPDRALVQAINELRSSPDGARLSFSAARDRVMKSNPALAKEYIHLTEEV